MHDAQRIRKTYVAYLSHLYILIGSRNVGKFLHFNGSKLPWSQSVSRVSVSLVVVPVELFLEVCLVLDRVRACLLQFTIPSRLFQLHNYVVYMCRQKVPHANMIAISFDSQT